MLHNYTDRRRIRSRQITTPAPHHSVFIQAGCPSCRPTNSVKALKALSTDLKRKLINSFVYNSSCLYAQHQWCTTHTCLLDTFQQVVYMLGTETKVSNLITSTYLWFVLQNLVHHRLMWTLDALPHSLVTLDSLKWMLFIMWNIFVCSSYFSKSNKV